MHYNIVQEETGRKDGCMRAYFYIVIKMVLCMCALNTQIFFVFFLYYKTINIVLNLDTWSPDPIKLVSYQNLRLIDFMYMNT